MYVEPIFRDRYEAGEVLAERLRKTVKDAEALVLALPRGGVPVGFEIARRLPADLDVFLVRKLGVPGHEELAMGAIASGGVKVLNEPLIRQLQLSSAIVDQITQSEWREIERRELLYREGRPPVPVRGRSTILVDDGLATGATMLAAARAVRALQPSRLVVAVPVAAPEACAEFQAHVDEVVCAATPDPFYAVGVWYDDFSQTSDEEVCDLLARAAQERV
jgi:putative phosphoribosyl transferase